MPGPVVQRRDSAIHRVVIVSTVVKMLKSNKTKDGVHIGWIFLQIQSNFHVGSWCPQKLYLLVSYDFNSV